MPDYWCLINSKAPQEGYRVFKNAGDPRRPHPFGAPDETALIGSWILVSHEDRDSSGASVYPYGKVPAGLLIYATAGHLAIQIMARPPPDVASDDWDLFTVKEKVALYDAYTAYFSPYEVDSGRK